MSPVRIVAIILVLIAALTVIAQASAIVNGVPDGDDHPNVGLLAVGVEEDGELVRLGNCSGFYAGPRLGRPTERVFVTAGHCINWLQDEGISPDQLWVTFDSETTFDPDTSEVISSNTWHRASAVGFDPALGDHGVVLLESVPSGLAPVRLPTAGLLDEMTERGGLRPASTFDNVGYGLMASFKQGPPRFEFAPGRMFSTSRFKGLTQELLMLNSNSDSLEGNGGGCFGDSGSPKLVHRTNTAVAITTGGDPICRSNAKNLRLDTSDARAFYGRCLALP
jgi:hypothetical protein